MGLDGEQLSEWELSISQFARLRRQASRVGLPRSRLGDFRLLLGSQGFRRCLLCRLVCSFCLIIGAHRLGLRPCCLIVGAVALADGEEAGDEGDDEEHADAGEGDAEAAVVATLAVQLVAGRAVRRRRVGRRSRRGTPARTR